jgi:hypothetical protein
MHVHQSANLTLPPRAIMGEGGKPLLSWRVAMLPYLGMGELYWEFKTDEPWDSPQNIKLLSRMPDLYRPRKTIPKEPHSTYLRAIVGPDTVFGALGETPKRPGASTSRSLLCHNIPVARGVDLTENSTHPGGDRE